MTTNAPYNPFRLSIQPSFIARLLERALGLTKLAQGYDARPESADAETFLDHTLATLGCNVLLEGQTLEQVIPETGPTIVFANHPFGGLEGVALTRALLAVRTDTKVITNNMLSAIPELSNHFLGVDVLRARSAHRNTSGVRAAAAHLEHGGVLVIFPAGQVSNITWRRFKVADREWNSMVGRLAKKYSACCVPIYVHGHNPLYFQLGGLIHKRIRTALLPRQLTNKANSTLKMTVGDAIKPNDIRNLESAEAITAFFRMSTYMQDNKSFRQAPHAVLDNDTQDGFSVEFHEELASLSQYKLLSKNTFDVYCAPYSALNLVFDELARAREKTFRAVGEGTGKEKDSDQFDPHYQHLFIWDTAKHAIVGGYRLCETKQMVKAKGVNALYSRSLYRYDKRFVENLGNALEVGRSFVSLEYQRHPSALDLLWCGIGRYVVKHPSINYLFGCVSISSAHSELARAFISEAMMESFCAEQKFLDQVKPIVPLRVKGRVWSSSMLKSIRDISVFNKLVGLCDPGKTIPVLLRQYIALNGRFIGFSVNENFNKSLDGLILVELKKMPVRYLTRYLGKDGLDKLNKHWKKNDTTVES